MTQPDSGEHDADVSLPARRSLLRGLLSGSLVVMVAALPGCAARRDLPPERRTRGRYGNGNGGNRG